MMVIYGFCNCDNLQVDQLQKLRILKLTQISNYYCQFFNVAQTQFSTDVHKTDSQTKGVSRMCRARIQPQTNLEYMLQNNLLLVFIILNC